MKAALWLTLVVSTGSALIMNGCAYSDRSADVYTAAQAQREATVVLATVESVRPVTVGLNYGHPTGLGAIGGGALGAVAGSALGDGRGSLLIGISGAIAGSVLGNAIENWAGVERSVEITMRLDNGEFRAITQADTGERFLAGERVRLLSDAGITRVTH